MDIKQTLINQSKELDSGSNFQNLTQIIIASYDHIEQQFHLAEKKLESNGKLDQTIDSLTTNSQLSLRDLINSIPSENLKNTCLQMYESLPTGNDDTIKQQVTQGLIAARSKKAAFIIKANAMHDVVLTVNRVVGSFITFKMFLQAKNPLNEKELSEIEEIFFHLDALSCKLYFLIIDFLNDDDEAKRLEIAGKILAFISYMDFLQTDASMKLDKMQKMIDCGCYQQSFSTSQAIIGLSTATAIAIGAGAMKLYYSC